MNPYSSEALAKRAIETVRMRRVYVDSQGYITDRGSYGVGARYAYRGIGQKIWCAFINDEPVCEVRAANKTLAKLLACETGYVKSAIVRMEMDK